MTAVIAGGATTELRWRVNHVGSMLSTRARLEADVRTGLVASPPTLPPRWFYDERGSRLFDEITRLPEYYPTRRETEILAARANEIAIRSEASTLVELGSGTSAKTRLLLDALTAYAPDLLFVPLDVSVEVLTEAAVEIAGRYRDIAVDALVADFGDPLPPLPGDEGRRLVAFFGGTIGNFQTHERHAFLDRVRQAMAPGDHLLLGADLIKDPNRLLAAYDDSRGVTAEFNLNLIEVLTRELDGRGVRPNDFAHVARWNADKHRMEMWLRARCDIDAIFAAIDLPWVLPAGAEILTEISVKFDLGALHKELRAHGFAVTAGWMDRRGDYSLSLLRAI